MADQWINSAAAQLVRFPNQHAPGHPDICQLGNPNMPKALAAASPLAKYLEVARRTETKYKTWEEVAEEVYWELSKATLLCRTARW